MTSTASLVDFASALETVEEWLTEYISASHPEIGRTGPICPFVAPSRKNRTMEIRLRLAGHAPALELIEEIARSSLREYELTTWQGRAYIAVVADAYSRLCLGWAVRADKTVELVLEALDMAIWRRGQMRASGAVHHSDQGSQYTSFAFTKRLAAEGIVASMGTVGDVSCFTKVAGFRARLAWGSGVSGTGRGGRRGGVGRRASGVAGRC